MPRGKKLRKVLVSDLLVGFWNTVAVNYWKLWNIIAVLQNIEGNPWNNKYIAKKRNQILCIQQVVALDSYYGSLPNLLKVQWQLVDICFYLAVFPCHILPGSLQFGGQLGQLFLSLQNHTLAWVYYMKFFMFMKLVHKLTVFLAVFVLNLFNCNFPQIM